jgi:hypothetical protein
MSEANLEKRGEGDPLAEKHDVIASGKGDPLTRFS